MPLELLHDDIHDTGQSLCKHAKLVIQRGRLREQTFAPLRNPGEPLSKERGSPTTNVIGGLMTVVVHAI